MSLSNQLRSIIEWENPANDLLFVKWTEDGDEIKNASKLIILPGQGCLFVYEGKIEGSFSTPGKYNLETDNVPFWTNLKHVLFKMESQHKVGIYFFRAAEMVNIRWGTPSPVTYLDPVYKFPVALGAFGNFSFHITQAETFFSRIVAGAHRYTVKEIQQVILSRITQPISNFLANAQWGYTEIDKHRSEIAAQAFTDTREIFRDLGFELLDFRIEGTSFDEETRKRISKISDMIADAQGIEALGINYVQYQQLQALRDLAKNEGGNNAGMQFGLGMKMADMMNLNASPQKESPPVEKQDDALAKLEKLKKMFEAGLIDESEYKEKKAEVLKNI